MTIMTKRTPRDRDQAWFWSKEWQRGEAQADRDIRAGRVSGPFRSVAELITHLQLNRKEK